MFVTIIFSSLLIYFSPDYYLNLFLKFVIKSFDLFLWQFFHYFGEYFLTWDNFTYIFFYFLFISLFIVIANYGIQMEFISGFQEDSCFGWPTWKGHQFWESFIDAWIYYWWDSTVYCTICKNYEGQAFESCQQLNIEQTDLQMRIKKEGQMSRTNHSGLCPKFCSTRSFLIDLCSLIFCMLFIPSFILNSWFY